MLSLGPIELILILLIVILFFGVGRMSKTAGELGKSRGFSSPFSEAITLPLMHINYCLENTVFMPLIQRKSFLRFSDWQAVCKQSF